VVVLLMLIPLLAPAENGAQAAGFSKIAKALGVAAVKVDPPPPSSLAAGLRPRITLEASEDRPGWGLEKQPGEVGEFQFSAKN
jgi:hypothetical protein